MSMSTTPSRIHWRLKRFSELSATELYEILALREKVFVVEQDCPYTDCDGKDPIAWHLAAYESATEAGTLVAYSRIFRPGDKCSEASFGRVVVDPEYRGGGLGRELTRRALAEIHTLFGPAQVRISAQSYLVRFYESFGFKKDGEEYLEDNKIPHFEMILRPNS